MNDAHDRTGKFTRKPVPADFREMAKDMYIHQIKAYYRVGFGTVKRWLSETGAVPLSGQTGPRQEHVSICKPQLHLQRSIAPTRIKSLYDDAADTLRRERFVVYRCNDKGAFDENGKQWRCGNTILSADELLQRAARYEARAA